jgi:hypothetical protein
MMTQEKTGPTSQSASAETDALAHLHRMSTTAGLGSQEYVAINVTSIIAVLFGVASLLAVASPVLLVFPVVGVILSVAAIRQINHSNGTQTGKGLAILGLLLSGLITAGILSYQVLQEVRQRDDQAAISALCVKYGDLLNEHKYAEAYDLFDAAFQARVGKPAFISQLTATQNQTLMPPISGASWNGLATFQPEDDGTVIAESMIKVEFKNTPGDARMQAQFRRGTDGVWLIESVPDQFPERQQAGQGQR